MPGIAPSHNSLARADATLRSGARFLAAGLQAAGEDARTLPAPITGRYRAKVIGNGLRELDRFLNVLLDEVAIATGRSASPAERNTANKLRALFPDSAEPRGEHARLRALGRARDCLFYCGGMVTRGDASGSTWLTVGWSDARDRAGPLSRFRVGERLAITGEDVADICHFYLAIATRLTAATTRPHAAGMLQAA
jgi:hypothetical protein